MSETLRDTFDAYTQNGGKPKDFAYETAPGTRMIATVIQAKFGIDFRMRHIRPTDVLMGEKIQMTASILAKPPQAE